MDAHAVTLPRWSTASIAGEATTSPMELSALSAHVGHCNGCRGRWFSVRCMVDTVHQFAAPRFITTLVIAASLIGVAALVL